IPELSDIKSLTHSSRPVKNGFSFDITKIITLETFIDLKPRTEAEWNKIRDFTTNYPMSRDILVSADGQYAIIMAILGDSSTVTLQKKKDIMRQAQQCVAPFIDKGIEIKFLSEPFVSAEFHTLVIEFLIYFVGLSLALMSIVILMTFRSLKILLFMLCYQAAGFLVFPIVFYYSLADINVYTMIIIPLISAVQLTFLTHFYSVFQENSQFGKSTPEILRQTLAIVLRPSLIALFTSVIGMAALTNADLPVLQTVGKVGVQSLLAIFTITFGPAFFLSFFGKSTKDKAPINHTSEFHSHAIVNCAKKFRWLIICLILTVTIVFSINFQKIRTDIRAKEFLSPDSETRQALEMLDKNFGGLNIFQLEVITEKPGDIQKFEFIKYMHDVREQALQVDGVLNAYTYSQFYTTIHQLFLGDNLSNGNVLPNQAQCNIYSMLINSRSFPFQSSLQNNDRSQTVFFLRTKDLPSEDFLNIVKEFQEIANKHKPPGVQIIVKKGIHSILESDQKIVSSQIHSLGLSLISIFLCLLVMWRSPRLAFIAIACNLMPLICIAIFMIIFNIALNSITVMIGTIILGIAVDDSIHFLSYYRRMNLIEQDPQKVLNCVLRHKIKPMVCTSIILIICLGLFYMAPFPPLQDFGILGSASLLAALLSTCFFLPILLMVRKKQI
ncbi:MAG: MMPL family transporter, partial [Lentisphaeraceae bacterium]|nr:MMPL family transporter [Lentisphaeraceae bacterium]